ncbi:MAG: FAD-dependent oxidoreductase [Planctomycetota bacterium]
MPTTDLLIVGHGLAGATLAWQARWRGLSVAVADRGGVDRAGRPSASRVAAGLITPITGKRLTLAGSFEPQREAAVDHYRRVEQETGVTVLHEAAALRLFQSSDERQRFAYRQRDAAHARHANLADTLPPALDDEDGAFWMPHAARLDTRRYLDASTARLQHEGRFFAEELDPRTELTITPAGVEAPKLNLQARAVCLCQGYDPTLPDWLAALPFAPAKGEVLRVRAPRLDVRHVVHRGLWLVPGEATGSANEYLVGSTYEWDRLDSTPTESAREELLDGLASLTPTPVEVIDHQAAVRPATASREPLVGIGPTDPPVAWLNGLGAKGSLLAPWHAGRLARRLADRLSI